MKIKIFMFEDFFTEKRVKRNYNGTEKKRAHNSKKL